MPFLCRNIMLFLTCNDISNGVPYPRIIRIGNSVIILHLCTYAVDYVSDMCNTFVSALRLNNTAIELEIHPIVRIVQCVV